MRVNQKNDECQGSSQQRRTFPTDSLEQVSAISEALYYPKNVQVTEEQSSYERDESSSNAEKSLSIITVVPTTDSVQTHSNIMPANNQHMNPKQ